MTCSHEPELWQEKHPGMVEKLLGLGAQLTLFKSGVHPIVASWHLDKSLGISFY